MLQGMPATSDATINRQGGALRWRTVTLDDGRRARVAVTRKPGPRGGRVVLVKILGDSHAS